LFSSERQVGNTPGDRTHKYTGALHDEIFRLRDWNGRLVPSSQVTLISTTGNYSQANGNPGIFLV